VSGAVQGGGAGVGVDAGDGLETGACGSGLAEHAPRIHDGGAGRAAAHAAAGVHMSSMNLSVVQLAGALAMVAAVLAPLTAQASGGTPVRANLEVLLQRTLFFGHQSVGLNILDGVAELARQEGIGLRVTESRTALGGAPGVIAHGPVADNGDPFRKLESFRSYFSTGAGAAPGLAFMKFCYADFHRGIDPAALFARYQVVLRDLQASHPGTTFVHLTAPLTTAPGGWRPLVGRLLGRDTSAAQNARREAFNQLLRQAYQGKEPLFDLARAESIGPDGVPVTVDWEGRPIPALSPVYSDDGGHLNGEGRRVVARQLVAFLASTPVAGPGGSP
jgi:lysophospholipase L1-like esterase